MSQPPHFDEHNELMQALSLIADGQTLTRHYIIITIGLDGRPLVGTTIEDVGALHRTLAQLSAFEEHVEEVTELEEPRKQ